MSVWVECEGSADCELAGEADFGNTLPWGLCYRCMRRVEGLLLAD